MVSGIKVRARTVARRLSPLLLLLTGACASIVSDNESTVYVATEPEKARCELHGQDFTRVVSTPASAHFDSRNHCPQAPSPRGVNHDY